MRMENKIIALSILCGFCIWPIDAYVGYRLFNEGTFWDLLFANVPAHELYSRMSIQGLFIAFGILASRCIAKRRRAEDALNKSRTFLQTVINNIPDGVMVIDLDYRILLANGTNKQSADGRSDAAAPMRCYEFSHHRSVPCDGSDHPCPLRQVAETKKPVTTTHVHLTESGDEVIMEIRAAPVLNEAGEVVQVIESFRDVTGTSRSSEDVTIHRQTDAELKRASVFLDSMSEALCVTNADLEIIRVNEAACKLWDYSREEMLGKLVTGLFAQSEASTQRQEEQFSALSASMGELETIALTKDGRMVPVTVSSRVLKDEQGSDSLFIAVVRDITERKWAEQALMRYQSQLRSLVSQLTMTEERERKEIEAALHDDLLQKLALCKMRLDELSQSEALSGHTNSLNEIVGSIRDMIRKTRSLTFDLISPVLYDIGLEAAVRDWLDREVKGKYDTVFEFEDDGQPRKLDEDLRVMLYRAVRELCTNVIKHSQAKWAKVQIRNNRNNVEIIVEDDGVGIEFQKGENDAGDFSYRGGLGLFGIRERLDHFGASMKIKSQVGAGTKITIIVPSHCQETAEKTRN